MLGLGAFQSERGGLARGACSNQLLRSRSHCPWEESREQVEGTASEKPLSFCGLLREGRDDVRSHQTQHDPNKLASFPHCASVSLLVRRDSSDLHSTRVVGRITWGIGGLVYSKRFIYT